MKTALWVALTLFAVAFAGCTEEPAPALTEDDCLVQGLILDPAVEQVDNETGETFVGPACVENVPSVTVHLEGISDGDSVQAWTPVSLTWVMHTTLENDHSHNNGIRVSTTSDPSYQGKVDGYGEGLLDGKEEHRNFVEGDSSTVTWTPEDPGTYYVRAYAVSAWGNFWAPEHEVTVTEVAATGNNTDVTIQGGGLPGATSIDQETVNIALGDTVTWKSDEPVNWVITRKSGPDKAEKFTVDVDEPLMLTVPGVYAYRIYSEEVGESGEIDGSINVAFPE